MCHLHEQWGEKAIFVRFPVRTGGNFFLYFWNLPWRGVEPRKVWSSGFMCAVWATGLWSVYAVQTLELCLHYPPVWEVPELKTQKINLEHLCNCKCISLCNCAKTPHGGHVGHITPFLSRFSHTSKNNGKFAKEPFQNQCCFLPSCWEE